MSFDRLNHRTGSADRGLKAVERVRGVREQDSRIGLQAALAEERELAGRLSGHEQRLATAALPESCSVGELVALRTALGSLGTLITQTRMESASATALAADARSRWSADKARLAAVEHLLARRVEVRRAAAARRTATELDDLAAQRWLRTQVSTSSTTLSASTTPSGSTTLSGGSR